MEASANGIDVGGRALTLLAAFLGESAEQNRVFFKVKGKKLFAAATAKNRSIELEGKANGAEDGEWPVDGAFIRKLSGLTVNGTKKVPGVNARLLLERTGVSVADLVMQGSDQKVDTLQHHAEMPKNTQLSFKEIHATIDVDFTNAGGSWYPFDKSLNGAVGAVLAATKGCPVSFAPGMDEHAPVGFQSTGPDFVARGILMPPAVTGPGRGATNPEPDEDDDNPRQPGLFQQKATGADDDGVIDDDEAERIKREQQAAGLSTAKKPKARKAKKVRG